jgi:hypothetical protein
MSVCNTGTMGQLAANSSLSQYVHGGASLNVFEYVHRPTIKYAMDHDVTPLGPGHLSINAPETLQSTAPSGFDLITDLQIIATVPAVANVTDIECDISGAGTNVNSTKKVRAYTSGLQDNLSAAPTFIVDTVDSAAATHVNTGSFQMTAGTYSNVKPGDYVTAYPSTLDATHEYDAASFGAVSDPPTHTEVNAIITALEAATGSTLTTANLPVFGVVSKIDAANHQIFLRHDKVRTQLNPNTVYHMQFSRTNKLHVVGDDSASIPTSDSHAVFTKLVAAGPNYVAAVNGLDNAAAGLKSDIAAYYQPYCLAQLIDVASLNFSGVCADALTGTHIQIYHELYQRDHDRNVRRLNAVWDVQQLKANALQPQEFAVKIPFGFFTDRSRALNMEHFKYTDVTLSITTKPFSSCFFGNGCGGSFGTTITSDKATGTGTAATLSTKVGRRVNSMNPFSDSKSAPSFVGLTDVAASDIHLSAQWTGVYMQSSDRARLAAMTSKILMPQHAVSETISVNNGAHTELRVAGSNLVSAVTIVAQRQSALNHARASDFRGQPVAGSGATDSSILQYHPLLKSVRVRCAGKNRTSELSAEAALAMGQNYGATRRAPQNNDLYTIAFSGGHPYGVQSEGGMDKQMLHDVNVVVRAEPSQFNDNSASGYLNGKSKASGAGLATVEGGERVFFTAYSVVQNLLVRDGDAYSYKYPC